MTMKQERSRAIARIKKLLVVLGGLIALLWAVELIDQVFWQGRLDGQGIRPRNLDGLWGIFWAPFLHSDWSHLWANTLPLLSLGWLILLRDLGEFLLVNGLVLLVGGLGTWVFGGPNTVHIGASGLVFGYFGFLLSRGYFEREFMAIALSVLVLVMYSGLLIGILPTHPGISWQGHLFGFLGGILAAKLLSPSPNKS